MSFNIPSQWPWRVSLALCWLFIFVCNAVAQPPDNPLSMVDSAIPVGMGPHCLAVADFNGDGHPDIATANTDGDTVSILLGDGRGGFRQAVGSPVTVESQPRYLVAADFNGDGKMDLAVANAGSNNLSILLGDGSGGFKASTESPVPVASRPVALAAGDLNGDGKTDLVVANSGPGTVQVLLGDGAGGFATTAHGATKVGRVPSAVALGDLNGDGSLDVIVANQLSNTITVLLGDGTGGFAAHRDYEVDQRPRALAVADLNGDKTLDLVVVNGTANTVSVLLNDGKGGFKPRVEYATGNSPRAVAVADFRKRGRMDLATSNFDNNDLSVLLNDGTGAFAQDDGAATGTSPAFVAAADFNGDNIPDLAVANSGSNTVTILLGDGTGRFRMRR